MNNKNFTPLVVVFSVLVLLVVIIFVRNQFSALSIVAPDENNTSAGTSTNQQLNTTPTLCTATTESGTSSDCAGVTSDSGETGGTTNTTNTTETTDNDGNANTNNTTTKDSNSSGSDSGTIGTTSESTGSTTPTSDNTPTANSSQEKLGTSNNTAEKNTDTFFLNSLFNSTGISTSTTSVVQCLIFFIPLFIFELLLLYLAWDTRRRVKELEKNSEQKLIDLDKQQKDAIKSPEPIPAYTPPIVATQEVKPVTESSNIIAPVTASTAQTTETPLVPPIPPIEPVSNPANQTLDLSPPITSSTTDQLIPPNNV